MNKSKRQQILELIEAKLKTLTDIALPENVFYWHDFPLEWQKDAIRFQIEPEENKQNNLILENEFIVKIQAVNYTEEKFKEEAITDQLKRAFLNETWNGLSLKTLIVRNHPIVKTQGLRSVSVFFYVKIKYRENLL